MKKSILTLLFLISSLLSISQHADTFDTVCVIKSEIKNPNYFLTDGIINKKGNLILMSLGSKEELARRAHYIVIDIKKQKIISHFKTKHWTYLSETYFYQDSLLYINYAQTLHKGYLLYSLQDGLFIDKVKNKDCPMHKEIMDEELENRQKISLENVRSDNDQIMVGVYILSYNKNEGLIIIKK